MLFLHFSYLLVFLNIQIGWIILKHVTSNLLWQPKNHCISPLKSATQSNSRVKWRKTLPWRSSCRDHQCSSRRTTSHDRHCVHTSVRRVPLCAVDSHILNHSPSRCDENARLALPSKAELQTSPCYLFIYKYHYIYKQQLATKTWTTDLKGLI